MTGWLSILVHLGASLGAETLTIATYNLENYGPADRLTEAGYRKAYPKPEAEKTALRQVIRGIHADILVVQEMGPQIYLDELRRDLKAEGLDYPHAVLLEAADDDRHVALFSKRPLKAIVPHAALEFSYFGKKEKVKRGLLEVTVSTEGGDVTLFAVHLKSRFTDRPDDPESALRRAGEATAVRDCVLQRFPHPAAAQFLILGDCNDGKNSKPLDRLTHRGSTTIAALLPAADSHGDTWTHSYRKEETYSHVDHILVSPGLHDAIVAEKTTIFDGPGVREASDHRPVMVALHLEAGRKDK